MNVMWIKNTQKKRRKRSDDDHETYSGLCNDAKEERKKEDAANNEKEDCLRHPPQQLQQHQNDDDDRDHYCVHHSSTITAQHSCGDDNDSTTATSSLSNHCLSDSSSSHNVQCSCALCNNCCSVLRSHAHITSSLRCRVFHDLWCKGWYVSSGSKFGADFLLYKGDPLCVHADWIVHIRAVDERFPISDLVASTRVSASAKKGMILASEKMICPRDFITEKTFVVIDDDLSAKRSASVAHDDKVGDHMTRAFTYVTVSWHNNF
jgi:tRNA splicing endonuclease